LEYAIATSYPTSLDTLTNPSATDTTDSVDHAAQHSNANDAIEAIEAKLGTGSSDQAAATDKLLIGTGAGTSDWSKDVPSGAILGTTDTQTLTNKTLTAPKITSGSNIADSNGNELIEFPSAVASAVNQLKLSNSASGNNVLLEGNGGDTNVSLELRPKGTGGAIILADSDGNEVLKTERTASAVNEITVKNAATGSNPVIKATGEADTGISFDNDQDETILKLDSIASAVNNLKISNSATGSDVDIAAEGTDTNIDISLTPKGSGTVVLPNDTVTDAMRPRLKACRLTKATTQTIATATDTAISFGASDTEDFDAEGWHDPSTNNSRITVDEAGLYLITGFILWTGDNTGIRTAYIYKNGSQLTVARQIVNGVGSAADSVQTQLIEVLASSDYIELYGRQTSGGNLDTTNTTRLEVIKLSD